jgi:glucose/mannose transport system substrate-binding protein
MKAFGLLISACMVWVGAFAGIGCTGMAYAQLPTLDVLHWWTSGSERRAADQLGVLLARAGVQWSDAAIPGGGGMAAVKVLKSRVLMGNPPDVAQLIGSNLTEWADMGLVLQLNPLAARQRWTQTLFPTVMDLVSYKGDVIAVPIGIHRINTLLYNRRLFAKYNLQPPRNWSDFEAAVAVFRVAGIKPLAWSDEAWQIATVFESLLLGEVGPALYREMIVRRKSAAWLNPGVDLALRRLRWLRSSSGEAPAERAWTDSARELKNGTAAMMVMGDWASGELMDWGADSQTDFGCVVVPGTDKMHLYSVDTLAMLLNARHPVALQERMAETFSGMSAQLSYNRIKGSVPVRKDISTSALASMDACERDSWEAFAAPAVARVPSLAHRMAADEASKDAVAQALWRFLNDPLMDVGQTQKRLALAIRSP